MNDFTFYGDSWEQYKYWEKGIIKNKSDREVVYMAASFCFVGKVLKFNCDGSMRVTAGNFFYFFFS